MLSFKGWRFVFLIVFVLFFSSCTFPNFFSPDPTYELRESLKKCWHKEKSFLKKIEKTLDESSITQLQKQLEEIKGELESAEALLKKVGRGKNLGGAEKKKYQEGFFLLSDVAEEIDSFLSFQLGSREERQIITELGWRLTLLSGKVAKGFNLISAGYFDKAGKVMQEAKTELNECRRIVSKISRGSLVSFNEVSHHLGKTEVLIKTSEDLIKKKKITKEEREKIKEEMKELSLPSLEIISLNEVNRDRLVREASLKLKKVSQILKIQ